MMQSRASLILQSVAVVIALSAAGACAPGRAVVRGNWPDGRLESPGRSHVSIRARHRSQPDVQQAPSSEWLPAAGTEEGTPADLNRLGVLKPIHFAFDSARIADSQVSTLEDNAAWLREHASARIIIEGHCDERGTREYNLALGERRARAARDFLVSLGVDPQRIEVVSYGEELPVDPGHNERAWAANRRAEFVLVAVAP